MRLIAFALGAAGMIFPTILSAQKKPMDHDVYDKWEKVSNTMMSDNGDVLVYTIEPQEGDGNLFIRNTSPLGRKTRTREMVIPRGYEVSLSPQGDWLYCRIKPTFAKSRREKIKKVKKEDLTPDTLAVVNLNTMTLKKYPNISSYTTGLDAKPYIAYKSTWTEKPDTSSHKKDSAKADSKKEAKDKKTVKGKTKTGLIILNPSSEKADTLFNVDRYVFSKNGLKLAFTTKKDKKDSLSLDALIIRHYMDKAVYDTLAKGHKAYGNPVFSDDCRKLAFTASNDTSKNINKTYSLFLSNINATEPPYKGKLSVTEEIVSEGSVVEGTEGWTLNENSEPFFTVRGDRIFINIGEIRPPKDTSIVDFETAQLDLWNWDDLYTPPQYKRKLNSILKKTYPAVINLKDSYKITPLTTAFYDNIVRLGGGESDWALSMDSEAYIRSSAWYYNSLKDLALVSLKDGSRKKLAEKLNAEVMVSSTGKYLLWYNLEDNNFYTYNIETGKTVNLTASTGVNFYNEENDQPTFAGAYERSPRWLKDDKALLIADRYDIWKFSPDGSSAENLTQGIGRRNHLRFRVISPVPVRRSSNASKSEVIDAIGPKDKIYLSVFNEEDMRNGMATMNIAKPSTLKYMLDTASFLSVTKAVKSEQITYFKGNFRNPYDLYITKDDFKTSEKITDINPQMDEYRWGRAELFEWKAYDGTPLKGLVFIPDGVKKDEKLPVMVYFYERYSESLYDFRTPAPSRSIVNIPLYTSRGYICFIPDIVYKVGHPGESAYNCIVSGAEALCEKYPIADKSRMAIQGQSWGGYQTAYLITRTDMFKAAGAGAPVGNMTSAYGGIRWGTGLVRAGQYECGQSRIGKTLWDEGGLELYIENSPVFHLDKVKTPVLIMHNDGDGAVPWYQGIEIMSNLRRLGKPAWMLQYNNEAHNLVHRRNCKDLSRRLQQFFDHYLQGAPMPAWMKTGIPIDKKGTYFGFENAE